MKPEAGTAATDRCRVARHWCRICRVEAFVLEVWRDGVWQIDEAERIPRCRCDREIAYAVKLAQIHPLSQWQRIAED